MIKLKLKDPGKRISVLLLIALVLLTAFMFVELIPLLRIIAENVTNEEAVTADIDHLGVKGVFLIIAIQALQVITTVVPSAGIQILAGLAYGLLKGMLICLAGCILGNSIVFLFVRQFDKTFELTIPKLRKFWNNRQWDFLFSNGGHSVALIAFALYLIPGIPNGILPYIFAKTKISLPRYLTSVGMASVPSILLCSLVGERIANGDIFTAVLVFCILGAIALTAVLMRKRILCLIRRI